MNIAVHPDIAADGQRWRNAKAFVVVNPEQIERGLYGKAVFSAGTRGENLKQAVTYRDALGGYIEPLCES